MVENLMVCNLALKSRFYSKLNRFYSQFNFTTKNLRETQKSLSVVFEFSIFLKFKKRKQHINR